MSGKIALEGQPFQRVSREGARSPHRPHRAALPLRAIHRRQDGYVALENTSGDASLARAVERGHMGALTRAMNKGKVRVSPKGGAAARTPPAGDYGGVSAPRFQNKSPFWSAGMRG